jgi:transcriptional regulator with XRE-family HTH domain
MKTLGEHIKEVREERDLSVRELAKKLNVSAPFLSDVELGRRHPSDEVLARSPNLNSYGALGTFDKRGVLVEHDFGRGELVAACGLQLSRARFAVGSGSGLAQVHCSHTA